MDLIGRMLIHPADVACEIKEAEKLGFTKALISKNAKTIATTKIEMKKINELVDFISYLKQISEVNR